MKYKVALVYVIIVMAYGLLLAYAIYESVKFNRKTPLYVISMKERRPERTRRFLERIQPSDAYYIANVAAVDGKSMFEQFDSIKRAGQAGCFLSHLNFWKEIAADNHHTHALILEDDANLRFPQDWHIVRTALSSAPKDWDIIWIGALHLVTPEKNTPVNEVLNENKSIIWGTHAYLISRTCAKYLAKKFSYMYTYTELKSFQHMMAVDIVLSNLEPDIKQYILRNNLIQQEELGSDTWN